MTLQVLDPWLLAQSHNRFTRLSKASMGRYVRTEQKIEHLLTYKMVHLMAV